YPGPEVQYHFVNIDVKISTKLTFHFLSSQMVTSNVEAYYPSLAQQYNNGYRLLTFCHIPGQVNKQNKSVAMFANGIPMQFQAIFCKYPDSPAKGKFHLSIEKSVIQPQNVWSGIVSARSEAVTDTSHLIETIATKAQAGARLVCIELTGEEEYQASFNLPQKMPILGVDIFFEIPNDAPKELYIYNVVSSPVTIKYSFGMRPAPKVICDWQELLDKHLSLGYRLVDIFIDGTQSTQVKWCAFSTEVTKNTQWFFEKPLSQVNDNTPAYQGTVVEHKVKIMQGGIHGSKTITEWETVMEVNKI
ncbi:unnamed protein product, partial [Lymnaea stagnalis]